MRRCITHHDLGAARSGAKSTRSKKPIIANSTAKKSEIPRHSIYSRHSEVVGGVGCGSIFGQASILLSGRSKWNNFVQNGIISYWDVYWPTHFLRLFDGFFGFRHSGDATHASGRQGVRDAEPNGRFGISTTLGPPVRSDSRGFRRLRP